MSLFVYKLAERHILKRCGRGSRKRLAKVRGSAGENQERATKRTSCCSNFTTIFVDVGLIRVAGFFLDDKTTPFSGTGRPQGMDPWVVISGN